ncbi:MAG: aldehyde dehydrogenase family protein [Desulfobacteraceae bacterium]|nr:aldehyde dehydrogenase family protein [Desulfobacteraceae bacterium]
MTETYQAFINGQWAETSGGQTMTVINPATGQPVAEAAKCGTQELEKAVEAAENAGPGWANTPVSDRSKVLLKASKLIMEKQNELAELETREHGSPIRKTMNFDIPLWAEQLEYFAGVARGMTGETLPVGPWCMSATVREPLGVIGLITPWNFPGLMVIWKLGAALVTGNTCVVKPPSVTPLAALKIAEIFNDAGAPAGAVNVVPGPGKEIGEALVKHPKVAKIGFTGDTETGKRISQVAAEQIKPVGLELGGKNAFVVLEDADIDSAVQGAIFGAFFNSGQVCASASRFYIHESKYDEFAEKFVDAAKKLRYGDTMDMGTAMGPVAYAEHRDKVEQYINEAKQSGAKLLLGGERPQTEDTKNGFFVAPTIFGDCDHDARFMREEIFGPVVGLCRFKETDEAIRMTNDTPFGLSASLWTGDSAKGVALAGQIKVGTVWINEHLIIFCDTPWGGCKESGWGKDLSKMVLEEYTLTKHVYMDLIRQPQRPWYGLLE